ncbi:MAG: hypothetical protein E7315_05360 [Clostridiales bacterium]|nr:hypothetical protein [Clostridiales bacterium]
MPLRRIRKGLKKKGLATWVIIFLAVIAFIAGVLSSPYTKNILDTSPAPSPSISATPSVTPDTTPAISDDKDSAKADLSKIPEFSEDAFVVINNNIPYFSQEELNMGACEKYSPLDIFGRCSVAFAICGKEIMPADDEDRGSISSVTPSGWVQAKYDHVPNKYLYNRCHMIGWQLCAENANKMNLVTGTQYLNIEGMLPFENMVADYIKETNNHVAYRVTPIYSGNNLLCSGLQIEAYSIEDEGEGICFNVYCYNVQPGVDINYATGESSLSPDNGNGNTSYVLNTSSKRIHLVSCNQVKTISEKNKETYTGDISVLISQGYVKCGSCIK